MPGRRAPEPIAVEFVFTRADLQPVVAAIRAAIGGDPVPLDSPHRVQNAVATLIRMRRGRGDVVVSRSPAALLTPEYWQVRLTGLDVPTHRMLAQIFRVGR